MLKKKKDSKTVCVLNKGVTGQLTFITILMFCFAILCYLESKIILGNMLQLFY